MGGVESGLELEEEFFPGAVGRDRQFVWVLFKRRLDVFQTGGTERGRFKDKEGAVSDLG